MRSHIYNGDESDDRVEVLEAIAEWMDAWAENERAFNRNLILLVDFNIDCQWDDCYNAFVSTGLRIPAELEDQTRTIYDRPVDGEYVRSMSIECS